MCGICHNSGRLSCDHRRKTSPSEEECFRGADLRVYKGDSLLVVGTLGSVRAIAGLWQLGYGTVTWATGDNESNLSTIPAIGGIIAAPKYVFFLPQKSYNIIGSRSCIRTSRRQRCRRPNCLLTSSKVRKFRSSEGFSSLYIHYIHVGDPAEELEIIVEDESLSDEFFLELLEQVKLGSLAAKMGGGDAKKGLRKD